MAQKDAWKYVEQTDYVADLPGADIAANVLRTVVTRIDADMDVDVEDRADRDLGRVSVSGSVLDAALASNAEDALRVEPTGALDASAATVPVTSDGPLDASGATVPVESSSPLDASAATVPVEQQTPVAVESLPDADRGAWNGTTLAANASTSKNLTATGADRLRGRVQSSGSYDVAVEWLDGAGSVIFTESVASGVAGGTATDLDLLAVGTNVNVVVTDASAAEATVKGVLSLA